MRLSRLHQDNQPTVAIQMVLLGERTVSYPDGTTAINAITTRYRPPDTTSGMVDDDTFEDPDSYVATVGCYNPHRHMATNFEAACYLILHPEPGGLRFYGCGYDDRILNKTYLLDRAARRRVYQPLVDISDRQPNILLPQEMAQVLNACVNIAKQELDDLYTQS